MALVAASCGADEPTEPTPPLPSPPPSQILEPCAGADCPPCGSRLELCAEGAQHLGTTCCAAGDPLVYLDAGSASEAVDIEVNDTYAVLCGGFGARLNRIGDPTDIKPAGSVGDRCQHAAFGDATVAGQPLFLAHHGDSWVETPSLSSWLIQDGSVVPIDVETEPGVLYEGLAYRDGLLYVAAHAAGLRVYAVDDDGVLTFLTAVTEGLGNPWKVALAGDQAFVADHELGLAIFDLGDPQSPVLLGITETAGRPVDVEVTDDLLFAAEGGFGVEVFERDGALLSNPRVIDTEGTAQAVASNGEVLAVAAWSHVALYDPTSGVLVASEKLRDPSDFEQDLGVAMRDDEVFVAEWEGLHALRHRPGFIAADLWLDDQTIEFAALEPGTRAVVLRNRGHLPLQIEDVVPSHSAYEASATSLLIPPGAGDFFELSYSPPGPMGGLGSLVIQSNDIDRPELASALFSIDTDKINVGDALDESFGFLDPSGAGQLSGLEGKVVVLAYFALF